MSRHDMLSMSQEIIGNEERSFENIASQEADWSLVNGPYLGVGRDEKTLRPPTW